MLTALKNQKHCLIEAKLTPVQGERFQPTGFPDIGAARYQLPNGVWKILVESAQSMANRLESTIFDEHNDLCPELKGLSYVRVQLIGATNAKTNTLIEAHRINSPFIITDKKFQETLKNQMEYKKGMPIVWPSVAKAFFKYDINSLIHGAFLANLEDGRIRLPRILTAFIEASDVREVLYGGVKNNPLDPTGKIRAESHAKDVYGNVPYHRIEYTAAEIKAFFNIDVGLARSYKLGEDATELLLGLSLLKIRRFLDGGLRLRTACDLKLAEEPVCTEPAGFSLPSERDLLAFVQERIRRCANMFATPPVTEFTTKTKMETKQETEEANQQEGA